MESGMEGWYTWKLQILETLAPSFQWAPKNCGCHHFNNFNSSTTPAPPQLVNSLWQGKYSQYCLKWGEGGCNQIYVTCPKLSILNLTIGRVTNNLKLLTLKTVPNLLAHFFSWFFNPFSLSSRQSTALFSQNTPVGVLLTNLTGWLYTPTPNSVAGC